MYNRSTQRDLNYRLPTVVCGNSKIPCGKRTKNKTCRCTACAYAIRTTGLKPEAKVLVLSYIKA